MSFRLGEIEVEVIHKDIKNVHLSVYPPDGRVRLAAPRHIEEEHLRLFVLDKLVWIRTQQQKFRDQEREPARAYIPRESHYVWGNRYLMEIEHGPGTPCVRLGYRKLILTVPEGMETEARGQVMAAWYRDEIREQLPGLLADWVPRMEVPEPRVLVQRMKTRWGSCKQDTGIIRLNTDLARKPPECLEYILVHELAHLLEHTHNARFVAIMDYHLPNWRMYRQTLNTAPLAHVDWDY